MSAPRPLQRQLLAIALLVLLAAPAGARNPIKNAFFNDYPNAEGSVLETLPSTGNHCGVCHFDFGGGGARNAYGLAIQVAINSGNYGSHEEAILSVENVDSDNDGFSSLIEITDTVNFGNTPTFPGLGPGDLDDVSSVNVSEIEGHLVPSGGSDTDPPLVTVIAPNGGESIPCNDFFTVSWTATDASGISGVDVYLSDDGGGHWKQMARGLPHTGSFSWFVPNMPGADNRLRVEARDGAGNAGEDISDGAFTIEPHVGGTVPTTLRDFDLAGTQPFQGGTLEHPGENCVTCHGDYNHAVEPWHNWRGSMMGQAMRDPHFLATMVIAEQHAPASGDLCLRCHTPGGWMEGRSADTSGGLLIDKDFEAIQCDFCHRLVDPAYEDGVSPLVDLDILNALDALPLSAANGQFVTDPDPIRRGPYDDAQADHAFLASPFHLKADLCGTCHDVSNPVFVQGTNPAEYVAQELDAPHPDGDRRNMFPVERTFSEWEASEYHSLGVFAPQFAGNKPDGIVSSCQDCHMKDVAGKGAVGGPVRSDLALHDLAGGNHFVPDILPSFYPGEVDVTQLQDAKLRAEYMLSLAASMELTQVQVEGQMGVSVRITNETGHKLPSGYPEGRRIWLNVQAYDENSALVYESGAYDASTGVLAHDADVKIYEIKPGLSTRLGGALGLPSGVSFNFVLNDTIFGDNRIPPRGYTYANFEAIQSPPVAYTYADGQYWDDTVYLLPGSASSAEVTLYYQSTSKEYIEFLRDENTTNDLGQQLHDAWVATGRAAPVGMVSQLLDLNQTGLPEQEPPAIFSLRQNAPNPFNPRTTIEYSLATACRVALDIYDARGRRVRELVAEVQSEGLHAAAWDGRDDAGRRVGSGVYLYRLRAGEFMQQRKMLLLK